MKSATTSRPATSYKQWGLHVRVASLRSKRNWGIGDFTDLKNVANFANAKHAHVISIEPLQPVNATDDWNVVLFASRSFISAAYIDVEVVPDYNESDEIHRHVLAPAFQAKLASLRSEPLVNLTEVTASKMSVLQLCYQHFREAHLGKNTARAEEFRAYQKRNGQSLREFALFEALKEKLETGTPGKGQSWKSWPAAYQGLNAEGTIEFAQSNLERIESFEYVQWIASDQLSSIIDYCLDKQSFSTLAIQQPDRLDVSGPDSWISQADVLEHDAASVSPVAFVAATGSIAPGSTAAATASTVKAVIASDGSAFELHVSGADANSDLHYVTDHDTLESLRGQNSQLLLLPLLNFLHDPGDSPPTDWRSKISHDLENLQDEPVLERILRDLNKARPRIKSSESLTGSAQNALRQLPSATYRFQFNKEFTFKDATKLVPYLAKLGVSHCYASPFLKARPGSMHGYDIIDHKQLNPEIGTVEEFDKLVATLHEHGMGLILDIVPNHMGIGKVNHWWMDVLENGPASIYVDYFDIDWTPVKPELYGKVTLPVLGDSYGAVLKGGHFKLQFTPATGSLAIRYYDNEFPVNPATYPQVLGNRLDVLKERLGKNNLDVMEYESIVTALAALPSHTERKLFSDRVREKQVQLNRLSNLCNQNPEITNFIQQNLSEFEVRPDDKQSFDRMHKLLETQAYRLVFWRVASDEINYRRFFDINELAAVRTEDPRVFAEMHDLVFNLVGEGKLSGLRIDHPDGLFDPAAYFSQLQQKAAERLNLPAPPEADLTLGKSSLPIYIVVEKILAPFEHLEDDWAVHGTVGYEFLNSLLNVFVSIDNEHAIESTYEAFIGRVVDYESAKRECKGLILDTVLASELHVLAHRLSQIAEMSWEYRDFTQNSLRKALRHIVSNFPVYRTYVTPRKVDKTARQYIDWAVRLAKRFGASVTPEVYDFVGHVLCLEAAETPAENDEASLQFLHAIQTIAMKFQQFTGPVMAKSVEDTLFYRFNRFVCLNEVGGEPDRFGITVASFHHQNTQRQLRRPYEMLASSTHDTKRSEDVRARLAVLSELPRIWDQKTSQWARINRSRKTVLDEEQMPDANDEYLIYQTLVGACPVGVTGTDWLDDFKARITEYILKAARESKSHTSWVNKNVEYENALSSFIDKILSVSPTNPFLDDFIEFHNAFYSLGLINSLAQAALKFTSPGVPDIYQGNEIFDFSLVDPDNRRPVDFGQRAHMLNRVSKHVQIGAVASDQAAAKQADFLKSCLTEIDDGTCKLLIAGVSMACRRQFEDIYTRGRYIPLSVSGSAEQHVIAFARELEGNWSITVVPRLVATLLQADSDSKLAQRTVFDILSGAAGYDVWGDTKISLPSELQEHNLIDAFSMQILNKTDNVIKAADVFNTFPVAIITTTK
ncbi:MAG TPA: malto-oligosyltrehalose synthase [Drouetiella sp.]